MSDRCARCGHEFKLHSPDCEYYIGPGTCPCPWFQPREAAGAGRVERCRDRNCELHIYPHVVGSRCSAGAGEGGEHGDNREAGTGALRQDGAESCEPATGRSAMPKLRARDESEQCRMSTDGVAEVLRRDDEAPLTPADVERWERRHAGCSPNDAPHPCPVARLCAEVRRLAGELDECEEDDCGNERLPDEVFTCSRCVQKYKQRADRLERELQRERTSAENLARLNLYERVVVAERELERWRHDNTVEGDFVCEDALARSGLESENASLVMRLTAAERERDEARRERDAAVVVGDDFKCSWEAAEAQAEAAWAVVEALAQADAVEFRPEGFVAVKLPMVVYEQALAAFRAAAGKEREK